MLVVVNSTLDRPSGPAPPPADASRPFVCPHTAYGGQPVSQPSPGERRLTDSSVLRCYLTVLQRAPDVQPIVKNPRLPFHFRPNFPNINKGISVLISRISNCARRGHHAAATKKKRPAKPQLSSASALSHQTDMGAGDGNGTLPKVGEVAMSCDDGPGQVPFSKRPHVPDPGPPQQVSDPANYAVAGKILLAVAGAFAGVLLALVALHLYSSTRRRRLGLGGGGGQRRLLRSLAIAGGGDEDRRDGALPSPRGGLDPAVLAAIPVVVVDDAGARGDCAVCLAELEPGEKARALPRCGHRFHVECIDAWFRGNATCPLCRADVVVVAPAGAAAPSAPPEGGAQPEVRIDVMAGDAVAALPANGGSTVAPVMGRLHSGRDLEKARRVFASTRFSSF